MKRSSQQVAVQVVALLVVLSLIVGVLPANAFPIGPLGIFSLTKSASPSGGVYPGQEITYTLNIENVGTSSNAFLADPIPTNTNYVAGSVTGGAYYETSGNRIVWNKSPLPSGDSATIQFKVVVTSGLKAGTPITNTATLYDSDPDTGGLPIQDATTINTVLNPLTVSKTGPATAVIPPPPAAASDTITYTISLQNNGPVALTAGVDDPAPAGTKYKSATASDGSTVTGNDSGITWSGGLASGGAVTITYAITTGVNITTGQKIVNTATITNSETTDSKTAGPVTTTVQGPISATKTVDKNSAYPGETLHYTIIVTNVSSSVVTAKVTDTLPSDLNAGTLANLVGGLWDGTSVTWASSLASGDSHTISFDVDVKSSGLSSDTITNTTQINDSVTVFNVSATTHLKSLLDASTKTDAPDPVQAGGQLTYTVTLRNDSGTADATGASLYDPAPNNTSVVTATASPSHGTLTVTTGTTGSVSWSGTVSKTTPVVVTYVVNVASPLDNGTVITNTATITDGSGLPSFMRTATTTVASAPILTTSTKDVDNATPEPGDTIQYTITLRNTGNMVAHNVQLSDPAPSYVTFDSASPGVTRTASSLAWTGTVTPEQDVVITATAAISDDIPLDSNNQALVTNTATVDGVQLTRVVTVTGVPILTAGKSVTPTGDIAPGGLLTYTVVITGGGTGTAHDADLFDAIPDNTSVVGSPTCTSGDCFWSGADNAIHWRGDVTKTQKVTVTFTTRVTPTVFEGTNITNVATFAKEPLGSRNPTNVVTNIVNGSPDFSSSTKSVNDTTPRPGDRITYTVVLKNVGTSNPLTVCAVDQLDGGAPFALDQASITQSPAGAGSIISDTDTITWTGKLTSTLSPTPPAQVVTLTYAITVGTDATDGQQLTDSVAITSTDGGNYTVGPVTATVKAGYLGNSTKTVDKATAYPGDVLLYTITLNNTMVPTTTARVTDTIPANTTYVAGSATGGLVYANGVLTYTGTVTKNVPVALTFRAKVSPTVTANSITNQAGINDGSKVITRTATTSLQPALAVSKDVDKATASPDDTLTYTITLTNRSSIAVTASVTDTIDSNLTVVTPTITAPGVFASGKITWTGVSVPAGSSTVLNFQATVKRPLPNGTLITDKAQVSESTGLAVADSNTVTTTVSSAPDLSITKTVNNPTPKANEPITYTIVLQNNGTENASTVWVTDTLPTNVTPTGVQGGSYTVNYNVPVTITIPVTVDSGAQDGDLITNTVVMSHTSLAQPVTKTVVATVYGEPIINATKTVDDDTPEPGQTITYTIVMTNTGNVDAVNTTLSDPVPANTTGSALNWTGTISKNTTVTKTMVVQVDQPLLDGTLITNTATISQSRLSSVVTASKVVTVTGVPDILGSSKSVSDSNVYPGQRITYTIVLTNAGTGDATGTSLYDPIDTAKTTYAADSLNTDRSSAGLPDAYYLADSINWVGTLSKTQEVTITYAVTVGNLISGTTILNDASLYTQNQVTPTKELTATSTVIAPLTGSKSHTTSAPPASNDEVAPGGTITYTIVLNNNSTTDRTATVSDPVPDHTTGTPINWTGVVTAGQSVTFTKVVTVDAPLADGTQIANSATITDDLGNVMTLADTPVTAVATPLSASAKTVNKTTAQPGDELTYAIVLTNSAGSPVNVTVTDTIPANTTYVPDSVTTAAYDSGQIKYTGLITPSTNITITFKVRVNTDVTADQIVNTAEIYDYANPVIQRSATTHLESLLQSATKTPSSSQVTPGNLVTYTVALTNSSNTVDATGASLSDPIPAGLTYVGPVTSTFGSASYSGGAIQWNGTVSATRTVYVTYTVQVDLPQDDGTVITNTATILDGRGTSAITKTAPVTVNSVEDLSSGSSKTISNSTPNAGDVVTYTITVSNSGTMNAYNVVVTDSVPISTSYVAGSASPVPTAGPDASGVITWNVGTVAPNVPVDINFQAQVDSNASIGQKITNTAWISSTAISPFSRSAIATVTGVPDLSTSTKSVDPTAPVVAGQTYTYTILVKNTGNLSTTFDLVDPIPSNATYVGGSVSGANYNTPANRIECASCGPVAAGGTYTITFKVTANANPGNTITNTATLNWKTKSKTLQAVITDVPIAGLAATNDSPTQLGDTTTLTATVTDGTGVTYAWDFGDGSSGTGAVATHVYTATGVYTATVTATNGAGSSTATTVVTINDVPIAGLAATNDSPTQLGDTTTLTATVTDGTNVTYAWDFGDGSSGTGAVATHVYAATGVYTATVTATNGAGSSTATTVVTINDVPIAGLAATNDSPTQAGDTTTLTATVTAGTNVTYAWDFGDGSSGTGAVATHVYAATGVYTATVTATNGAGSSTATTVVNITAGAPATVTVVANPASIPADGSSTSLVTATVTDQYGNPVSGQSVTFATDLGTITGSATTDANGQATATLTSETTVGNATVTATAGAASGNTTVAFTGGTLVGTVGLQYRTASSAYPTVITVEFKSGATVVYATTVNLMAASSTFTVTDVPVGTWDVRVKNFHTLANAKTGVAITSGGVTSVNMGTLLEGDASNDNLIDISDYSLLRSLFGTNDARADFNQDGNVDIVDYSILRTNFGQSGDISVAAPMGKAPESPIAPESAAGEAPSKAMHAVALTLDGPENVAVGDEFSVDVMVRAGALQHFDGAQAVIHFDPAVLALTEAVPSAALPDVLQNTVDPDAGLIRFAAGDLSDSPQGQAVLVTLHFKALKAAEAATIEILNNSRVASAGRALYTQEGAAAQLNVKLGSQEQSFKEFFPFERGGSRSAGLLPPSGVAGGKPMLSLVRYEVSGEALRGLAPDPEGGSSPVVVQLENASGTVAFRFNPSSSTVGVGDIFLVEIRLDSGTQTMDGAQAYVQFDPAYLQVVDAAGNPTTHIIAGTAFNNHILNDVNNTTGLIRYSDGVGLTEPEVSGDNLLLATIRFKALAGTASTALQFQSGSTKATSGGSELPVTTTDGAVSISAPTPTNTPTATATDTPGPTATATNTPLATATNTPTPTATNTPTPTSTATPGIPTFYFSPSPKNAVVGDIFTVELRVDPAGVPVDGAQAYVNFDPTYLQVVDAAGNPVSSITPGSTFGQVVQNNVDNTAGQIDYAAGRQPGDPSVTTDFLLATIRFKALAAVSSTPLTFNLSSPRLTQLSNAGSAVTSDKVNGSVSIAEPSATVYLDPDPKYAVLGDPPFTVDIRIQPTGGSTVDSAEAYINFDPTLLQVVDAAGNPVNTLEAGSTFGQIIENNVDNATGQIDYAAGRVPGDPGVTTDFVLATIRFKPLGTTAGTPLTFNLSSPRGTNVANGGYAANLTVDDGLVIVQAPTPTPTNTPTATPTATATPVSWHFWGQVFRGLPDDTTSPLGGVTVSLYGSNVAGDKGALLVSEVTDGGGNFYLVGGRAYQYYTIEQEALPGMVATGAQSPSPHAVVISPSEIRYSDIPGGYYIDNFFWQAGPTPTPTATATATPTETPTATPTETPTPNYPLYLPLVAVNW